MATGTDAGTTFEPGRDGTRKPATAATQAANARVAAELPLDDPGDDERARRGRLAGPAEAQVRSASGWPVWDLDAYAFLDGEPPPTVNPSLWRQARLNRHAGLFELAPGFYQVRGLDLANVTFVAGETGWIVIDPLTATETARAALDLVTATLGARPVHAVIYTHSHVDHFGGVRGVISDDDVRSGRVEILAPAGFLDAAVSENVIAGTVMARRATYMYGPLLPRDPQGHVDAGLGKGIPLLGAQGLIAPTTEIDRTGTERTIDGVRIVFQCTPGTEAPAEMNFHFPDHRVLCMAENCTANLHNVYTPRGAPVRDALAWSKYLNESIELFGADTDVLFASHHWPRWGREDALTYLAQQRDLYRYLHDQTMRRANQGATPLEIAEELALPSTLDAEFHARGYYGTVSHNVRAVYQRYLGWFDGNPAHLHARPPTDVGRRYVEAMGGAERVLALGRKAFADGDYRWVVELVNHLVFADPGNQEARWLQADALEQLGYQAESAPWRDFYLTGAQELRAGPPGLSGSAGLDLDTLSAMTTEMLLDLVGVRLDGQAWNGEVVRLDLMVTDRGEPGGERWAVGLENAAIHATPGRHHREPPAHVGLVTPFATLASLVTGRVDLAGAEAAGAVVEGDRAALESLLALLDDFDLGFAIVEP